ncbi:MAG: 5-methyltetrahydrofolate--homocysteine methyltransferase [Eubacteriaceae bacterium]
MGEITKIPFRIDQEELFERMHIDESQPLYPEFLMAYDDLVALLPELLDIRGIYTLKVNNGIEKMHKGLCEVSHLVYCIVTLGKKISDQSTLFFKEKDYLRGLMIDSMADFILFNASNDYYETVLENVYTKEGYALTVRYSPDDHLIPMKFQKTILEETEGDKWLDLEITEGFMYYPLKTLGYVYGADKNIKLAQKDHDCLLCSNLECEYREV